jgi:phosphate transport system substrate-binding protein
MLIRALYSLFGSLAVLVALHSPAHALNSENNVITWAGCGITKKAFMSELAKAYEIKTGTKVQLTGGGATRGIRDTVSLRMDMGGSCRMSLPGEDRSELHASLHPVAWDALVVIINKRNPVKNLTRDQIKGIYMGKITNWRQVGGPNAAIHLYIRQGKISGVGYAIRQYLFEDSQAKFKTRKKYTKRSSGPIERSIEKDLSGIAITGVSSARKRDVKIISMDNHAPTYENVKQGKYGLYRPLYLVTTPTPSLKVKQFVSFARSKEGRKIIRENGTVPYMDAPHLMSKMLIYGFGVK